MCCLVALPLRRGVDAFLVDHVFVTKGERADLRDNDEGEPLRLPRLPFDEGVGIRDSRRGDGKGCDIDDTRAPFDLLCSPSF